MLSQKQPFTGIIQNSFPEHFNNILQKISAMEFVFNTVEGIASSCILEHLHNSKNWLAKIRVELLISCFKLK